MSLITIEQAGVASGIGSRKVYQILRQNGMLGTDNLPGPNEGICGYFVKSQRMIKHDGPWHGKRYQVTLVTDKGMKYLHGLAAHIKQCTSAPLGDRDEIVARERAVSERSRGR